MVPLSEEQAIQLEFLSKDREKISALSEPLLTSYIASPVSVENILMIVPLSLAEASKDPVKFRFMLDREFE